jgi:opacity protein-like surface antigen
MFNQAGKLVLIVLLFGSAVFGQELEVEQDSEWQGSLALGFFSGDTIVKTRTDEGEPVKAETNDGFLLGVRLGQESEFAGWEVTLANVFTDMNLDADPAADVDNDADANLFLANLNLLVMPIGNKWGEGRIRPYFTVGPGVVYLDSDFEDADGETMFSLNLGGGVKFLLGYDGKYVFRLDYRWHQIFGDSAGLDSSIYSQEISAGIGIRF